MIQGYWCQFGSQIFFWVLIVEKLSFVSGKHLYYLLNPVFGRSGAFICVAAIAYEQTTNDSIHSRFGMVWVHYEVWLDEDEALNLIPINTFFCRIQVKLDCSMNYQYYPADTQSCFVSFRGCKFFLSLFKTEYNLIFFTLN